VEILKEGLVLFSLESDFSDMRLLSQKEKEKNHQPSEREKKERNATRWQPGNRREERLKRVLWSEGELLFSLSVKRSIFVFY